MSRGQTRNEDWIDGAVLHNNPVEIALEESRRIAALEGLNPEPDVLLSVGTGLSRTVRLLGDIPSNQSHIGPPKARTTGWIRSLFTMVSYQIKLNTDADRRWAQVSDTDKHIAKKLYRINPDLQIDPPELDAVKRVEELAELVPRLISTNYGLNKNIQEVACALVASSFYFERNGPPVSRSSSTTEIHGWICCRLSTASGSSRNAPGSPALSNLSLSDDSPNDIVQLGRFINQSQRPEFMVYSEPKNADDIFKFVPVEEMMNDGIFRKQRLCITISGDDALTTIALRLPSICDKTVYPISGFPRHLMKMDFGHSYRNETLDRPTELPGSSLGFELDR